tara:strand:- start:86 stop:199 length:114 start_codon:yes stop_codon:yes gene_type:complete
MYLLFAPMGSDIEEGVMSINILNIDNKEDSNIIPLNM